MLFMTKKSWNSHLKNANKAKKDEFYTQLADIEREIGHYKEHFKGKIVFCNCDDPRVSNFFHYFSYNFEHLGLKKLIATCYKSQTIELFSQNDSEKAIYLEYSGDKNGNSIPNVEEIGIKYLKGDGDFRSLECIELLKQADIIVTNPPFSLFREYVAQLMQYDKKFVILGNSNALTYKEIFRLIKENKIWLGKSIHSWDVEFRVPDDYEVRSKSLRIDSEGNKYIRVPSIRWFTNLDYKERHEDLILYKKYYWNESQYPKYENYNAINIDVTKDIPMDYAWEMWVPITFMDKYSPEQFEIISLWIVGSIDFSNNRKMEILDKNWKWTWKYNFNAKWTLYRIYNPKTDKKWPAFRDVETGELYTSIYARVIIKNKKLTS